VRYAAADLEAEALGPVLEEAGLDTARRAFVTCLGVLIYLSKGAANAIFATAGGLALGSEFVFTLSRPDASTAAPPAPKSAAARVAASGEPWRTRFEPDVVVARLRVAGFRPMADLVAGTRPPRGSSRGARPVVRGDETACLPQERLRPIGPGVSGGPDEEEGGGGHEQVPGGPIGDGISDHGVRLGPER
jgi:O-methyltransferase involved in polyketide biosynthesis